MSTKNCGGFTTSSTQVGFDKDQACGDVAEVSNCLGKEVIDLTVDIWDDPGCDGDNVVRVFNENECVYSEGYFYWSLEDMNVDMPPSAKWSDGYTKCEMLKPSISLRDCSGDELSDGTRMASCSDLSSAVSDLEDAIDNIPKPTKCGGDEIDGDLVQCDQFAELFEEQFPNVCVEVDGVTDSCGEVYPLGHVSDGTDCGKFVKISEADIRIVRASYSNNGDGTLPHPFPTDRTDDATRYNYPDLVTDHGAGTIDAAKLANNLLFCVEVEIPCDGSYNFRSSATPVHTQYPDLTGKSRMVFSVDGDLLTNASSGAVRAARNFMSTEGEYSDDAFPVTMTAGTHTVCMYITKSVTDSNWPFCQVGTLGSPTLQIDRVIR